MAFQYSRTLTDHEEKVLLDSILDIQKWIDETIDGKIRNCQKRLADRWRQELIRRDVYKIPAKKEDLAKEAFLDNQYKNRRERENRVR